MTRRIALYSPDRGVLYDGRTPDATGIGGGHTSRLSLVTALAAAGHDVTAFVHCLAPVTHGGVRYVPLDQTSAIECDVLIAISTGGDRSFTPIRGVDVRAKLRVLLVQGVPMPADLEAVNADYVSVPSQFLRRVVEDRWGIPSARVFVSQNGIDQAKFELAASSSIDRDPYAIAYIGPPEKGLDASLEVLKRLRAADARYRLDVFGGSALWGRPPDPATDVPGVTLHGLVGQTALVPRLFEYEFCLAPQAMEEGFGIAVQEAKRAGQIVIASAVGAFPELFRHGVDGFLIEEPHTTEASHDRMAQLILELGRDPDRRARIRAEAMKTPWSWSQAAVNWTAFIDGALAPGPGRGAPSSSRDGQSSQPAEAPRLVVAGYYGHGNLGDEAILQALLNDIRRELPASSVIVVSGDPARTRQDHGVAAISDRDVPAIIDAAGRSDLVVLGGGGLFQDYFGLDESTLLARVHWGLTYFAAFPAAALLMRRPFMLCGVGVGPLLTDDGARYTRLIAERAERITVRDAGSRDQLVALGIAPDRIAVTADPAFLLEPAPRDRADALLDQAGVPRDRSGLVVVAIRQWLKGVDPDVWQPAVAAALDRLVDRYESAVLFVPFQATAEDELTDDRAIGERIRRLMRRRERTFAAAPDLSASEVLGVFAASDLVLAMRLHGVVFAATAQVPVVALGYDPKVRAVMQQVGVPEYLIDLSATTADRLFERLTAAYLNRAQIRTRLAGAVAQLRDLARQNAASVAALLRERPEALGPSPEWVAVLQRSLLDRVKRAEEMETHAETLTAQLIEARDRQRDEGGRDPAIIVSRPPAGEGVTAPASPGTARLLAERTSELLALSAELHRAQLELSRRPGYQGRRLGRAVRQTSARVGRGARRATGAAAAAVALALRVAARAVLPASARERVDRRLLQGLMSAPAHAFDRYKRARRAQYGRDLRSVRTPGTAGLVSIVLPVYNGASTIGEAIDSVLAQSYAHFELIIVNDGSTDDTARIVDGYVRRDGRVQVIDQDNRTLPLAISRGMRAASGEFLTWTSADNRLKPECLQRLVDCLRRHEHWDMTYANVDLIGEDGQPLRGTALYDGCQRPVGSEHIHLPDTTAELNVKANNTIGAAFLYRSRVAYLLGDYSRFRFVMEDYDYWMRVNALMTVRHADFDEPIYEYRFHSKSLTSRWAEFDTLRRRDGLMIFDDFRRDFDLLPIVWQVDPRAAASPVVASLLARARKAGHILDGAAMSADRWPRMGVPVIQLAVADSSSAVPTAPPAVTDSALRVLVAGRAAVAAEVVDVDEGWDLCCGIDASPAARPRRLKRDYQGWLVASDADALFHAIDVRARSAHLAHIEAAVEAPEPAQCDASVVVCTRGVSDRLIATLHAVAGQETDARFEIVVVDNAPDRSAGLRETVGAIGVEVGERIVRLVIVACPIAGLSAARNVGLFESRGEVIAFLDDDAVPEPAWLTRVCAAFRAHPDAGVIGGHIKLRTPEPRPAAVRSGWRKYWSEYVTEYEAYTEVEDWRRFPWGANWSARRIALLRIGGFRAGYGRKGQNFGGGEELVAASLIRRLGYTIGIEPTAVVAHDVDPARFTSAHVRRTIIAGHMVGHRAQQDLYLPQPAGLVPSVAPIFTHHFDEDVPAGEGRWTDAWFRKQAQLVLLADELADLWRRARTPVVDQRR